MGATRRNSRRMQRRDLNKVRKIVQRESDRRVAELMREQEAHVQSVADAWDPFALGVGEPFQTGRPDSLTD